MDCFNKGFGLTALAAVFFVAGCASNQAVDGGNKPVVTEIKSDLPVYAKLDLTPEGKYYFSEFSFMEFKNSVNLNTLSHNLHTGKVGCQDEIYNIGPKKQEKTELCHDKVLSSFRTSSYGGEAMAQNTISVLVTVLSFGTQAHSYRYSSFDNELFSKALNEALTAQPREHLISQFNSIYQQSKQIFAENKTAYDNKWQELNAKLEKALVVKDNSQLYQSKPEVYIHPSNPVEEKASTSVKWGSASDLTAKLQEAANKEYAEGRWTLICHSIPGFKHTSSGCDQRWGTADELTMQPVLYTIDSASRYRYTPMLNASNAHISAVSEMTGRITLTNHTNSFLTIDSLSLYIGRDIETLSNLNVQLPPKGVNRSLSLAKYSNFQMTSLANVKKSHLARSIDVGLAMKYKVVDTNLENTLYKTNSVKIQDLPGQVY